MIDCDERLCIIELFEESTIASAVADILYKCVKPNDNQSSEKFINSIVNSVVRLYSEKNDALCGLADFLERIENCEYPLRESVEVVIRLVQASDYNLLSDCSESRTEFTKALEKLWGDKAKFEYFGLPHRKFDVRAKYPNTFEGVLLETLLYFSSSFDSEAPYAIATANHNDAVAIELSYDILFKLLSCSENKTKNSLMDLMKNGKERFKNVSPGLEHGIIETELKLKLLGDDELMGLWKVISSCGL